MKRIICGICCFALCFCCLAGCTINLYEVRELKNKVEELQSKVTELEDELAETKSQLDEANAENAELRQRIAELEEIIKLQAERIAGLEAENKALKEYIAELEAENQRLKDEIERLEAELEAFYTPPNFHFLAKRGPSGKVSESGELFPRNYYWNGRTVVDYVYKEDAIFRCYEDVFFGIYKDDTILITVFNMDYDGGNKKEVFMEEEEFVPGIVYLWLPTTEVGTLYVIRAWFSKSNWIETAIGVIKRP